MASIEQIQQAIELLVARLDGYDDHKKKSKIPDRSLSLHLLDHDILFEGQLHQGALVDIHQVPVDSPKAKIRLTMSSDDLVALTEEKLSFAHAWATGRVRLDASLRDLLLLRSLMR